MLINNLVGIAKAKYLYHMAVKNDMYAKVAKSFIKDYDFNLYDEEAKFACRSDYNLLDLTSMLNGTSKTNGPLTEQEMQDFIEFIKSEKARIVSTSSAKKDLGYYAQRDICEKVAKDILKLEPVTAKATTRKI